jgi:hypothetical protein
MSNKILLGVLSPDRVKNYIVPSYYRFLQYCIANKEQAFVYDIEIMNEEMFLNDQSDRFKIFLTVGSIQIPAAKKVNSKIFSIWDDLHYFNDQVKSQRLYLFNNADVLLLTYKRNFIENTEYSDFHSKAIDFPWFYCHDAMVLPKFKDRYDSYLLTGRISDAYKFRRSIYQRAKTGVINVSVLEHPGYGEKMKGGFLDDDFISYVSRYRGGIVTTSDMYDYTVSKYFEIPGSGCLMLCQHTPDLANLGFVDGVNCIYIDEGNLDNVACLSPGSLADIARLGEELIMSRHLMRNRLTILLEYIKKYVSD